MKTNTIKQIVIITISFIGLRLSGSNLIAMSGIESLLDGLNVMIFFSCFFPFLILSIAVTSKFFKSFLKLTTNFF
ncbi:MAG: hypothetical protein ACJAYY_001568 [Paraglaciecola sp.]|jgi:hypothetical protein